MFFRIFCFLITWRARSDTDVDTVDIPTFYIYEHPELDAAKSTQGCPRHNQTDDYAHPASLFVDQLRRHARRSLDADAAKVFIVPFDIDLSFKSGDCPNSTHYDRLFSALAVLESSFYFQKRNGLDHMWMAAMDWRFPTSLDFSDWGYFPKSQLPLLQNMAISREDRIYPRRRSDEVCGDKGAWRCTVVTPTASSFYFADISFEEWQTRPTLLHFRGCGPRLCHGKGAQYLREMIAKYLPSVFPGETIAELHRAPLGQYAQEMRSSRFCLVTRCDTAETSRYADALAAGCIPVILDDGWYHLNAIYRSHLNTHSFAPQVDESLWLADPVSTAHYVVEWPENVLRRMHKDMMAARPALLWRHPQSQTAAWLLREASEECLLGTDFLRMDITCEPAIVIPPQAQSPHPAELSTFWELLKKVVLLLFVFFLGIALGIAVQRRRGPSCDHDRLQPLEMGLS